MSLATSYRFEAMGENKSLKSALKRQQERIQTDEMMAGREMNTKLENNIGLKSNWNESLEHVASIQKAKNDSHHLKSEVILARKASIMVRKAALKEQLERDYKMYEQELHKAGKSFYIKRT